MIRERDPLAFNNNGENDDFERGVILTWFTAGYVNNGNTDMYASVKIKRHE
ncbi:MAG TPA: hypothetical protein VEL11_02315 [Candidatus Bathyarchaeia archaeon]|nr:hypothetical protein [Candidatus Bathyarchaeia archaeon]